MYVLLSILRGWSGMLVMHSLEKQSLLMLYARLQSITGLLCVRAVLALSIHISPSWVIKLGG